MVTQSQNRSSHRSNYNLNPLFQSATTNPRPPAHHPSIRSGTLQAHHSAVIMGGWPSHINTFIRNSGRGRGPQLTEKPTRQGPVTLFHRRRGVLYILWSWLTSTVDDEVEEDLMNV